MITTYFVMFMLGLGSFIITAPVCLLIGAIIETILNKKITNLQDNYRKNPLNYSKNYIKIEKLKKSIIATDSNILTGIIISTIIFAMIFAYPFARIYKEPWTDTNYLTHSIVNLKDNDEIEGRFSGRYVRGYIRETTTYHYYYKTADGGIKLQKTDESLTTIYETSDVFPCAKWYEKTRSYWWVEEKDYYCKIYVPEGTVITEFTIDMS